MIQDNMSTDDNVVSWGKFPRQAVLNAPNHVTENAGRGLNALPRPLEQRSHCLPSLKVDKQHHNDSNSLTVDKYIDPLGCGHLLTINYGSPNHEHIN
eukprot:CAMPEP_0113953772 /NCGR_PEP_ID=MMETSP0011_2-20120614/32_1 /TAXON_ID=101924 /ORGANISM="Rhodosorus marinus" /LENGTH=96 /DNA_ID=CAMNT_0000962525 /DNA_START=60 /DNA_END=350 /DNA_ORIENTATION=+ /assembly_acc=CAM_ASM_000156